MRIIILTLEILLFLSVFIFPCQSIEREYSLQISTRISYGYRLRVQTFPLTVSFELENVGDETFNGVLVLEAKTDKHSFSPVEFHISNLTSGSIYKDSTPFRTDDEGTYWFTFKIESDDLSKIKLYQDSELVDQGIRVKTTTSTYLYPFSSFLTAVIVVLTAIGIIVGVAYKKGKE